MLSARAMILFEYFFLNSRMMSRWLLKDLILIFSSSKALLKQPIWEKNGSSESSEVFVDSTPLLDVFSTLISWTYELKSSTPPKQWLAWIRSFLHSNLHFGQLPFTGKIDLNWAKFSVRSGLKRHLFSCFAREVVETYFLLQNSQEVSRFSLGKIDFRFCLAGLMYWRCPLSINW